MRWPTPTALPTEAPFGFPGGMNPHRVAGRRPYSMPIVERIPTFDRPSANNVMRWALIQTLACDAAQLRLERALRETRKGREREIRQSVFHQLRLALVLAVLVTAMTAGTGIALELVNRLFQ